MSDLDAARSESTSGSERPQLSTAVPSQRSSPCAIVSDLASDARVFEARFRIDKRPRITRQVVFNKHARRDEDRRIVLLSYAPVERDVLAILVGSAVAATANQRAIVPESAVRAISERVRITVC